MPADLHEMTMDAASLDVAAAAMDAVFAGYSRAIVWTPQLFQQQATTNDVRLDASPMWYDDAHRLIAAALLALRGDRAWVGGFGVTPAFRGRGFGTRLIDDLIGRARAAGARTLTLEVLADNAAALATYERAGFSIVRQLVSLRDTRLRETAPLPEYDIDAAVAATLADAPCWQLAAQSLAHRKTALHSVGEAEAFLVYSRSAEHRRVVALKTNARVASQLDRLATAACTSEGFDEILLFNTPADGAAARAACELAWAIDTTQFEMQRVLA